MVELADGALEQHLAAAGLTQLQTRTPMQC